MCYHLIYTALTEMFVKNSTDRTYNMTTLELCIGITLAIHCVGFIVCAIWSLKMLGVFSKSAWKNVRSSEIDVFIIGDAIIFVLISGFIWPLTLWFRTRRT
jgi:hypothetical protein